MLKAYALRAAAFSFCGGEDFLRLAVVDIETDKLSANMGIRRSSQSG